ncbi:MAG: HlyC/CorC family transporter [Verrucomicrobia bacterium]|nr:HlyC/CorC family transporter [Verrucomicrobiota bacterium]
MSFSTFLLESPFLPIFSLLGSAVLSACSTALLHMGKFKSKELLRSPHPPLFFFRPLLKRLSPKSEWENLYFFISVSKHTFQLAYAVFSFFYILAVNPNLKSVLFDNHSPDDWGPLLLTGAFIVAVSLFFDFVLRLAATLWSRSLFKLIAPIASIYLIFLFPFTGLLLQFTRALLKKAPLDEEAAEWLTDKTKLREMIRESELQHHLDLNDQKLISSFINFKERVAKEIMVPRVDVFSLEADTPIRDAARLFASEGYSRIPVFRETLDQIVGVVLYKDLLKYYASPELDLDAPLESLVKPVLYAPENKKIAQLLQEFRNKQIHMAIIVDEYGGTEGIVTIEDILEELVGEIEDEYDIGEDQQFWSLPTGGWVVDAKMSIIDIEEQLGIKIPSGLEYETIGGYVFHCAGTIPVKGWRLLRDEFELEVLSSNERSIKKIKIVPRTLNIE